MPTTAFVWIWTLLLMSSNYYSPIRWFYMWNNKQSNHQPPSVWVEWTHCSDSSSHKKLEKTITGLGCIFQWGRRHWFGPGGTEEIIIWISAYVFFNMSCPEILLLSSLCSLFNISLKAMLPMPWSVSSSHWSKPTWTATPHASKHPFKRNEYKWRTTELYTWTWYPAK